MTHLSHIIYYVADVQRAIEFYQKVFDLKLLFLHESGAYAELETGTVKLAFAAESLGALNLPRGYYKNSQSTMPAGCEIVFTTDDVDALFNKAIETGAKEIAVPTRKPWGQKVGYVQDPQGILIELASRMA